MISFEFNDNNTGHKDLYLHFAGDTWICDSYYLALDQAILPELEDGTKIRSVLCSLLQQWIDALKRLSKEESVYLPFDFSDQSTRWLECSLVNNETVVSLGYSMTQGWALTPSKLGDLTQRPRGFVVDGPSIRCQLEKIQKSLEVSISRCQ